MTAAVALAIYYTPDKWGYRKYLTRLVELHAALAAALGAVNSKKPNRNHARGSLL